MTTGSSPLPRRIVLAGFMGAGKTTVGQIVAARLGWPFVDTDDLIEQAAGQAVAAIFAQQGEATFRQMERDACARAAALERHVIATGGGALLDPATRAAFLAGGLVIWLRAGLETIRRRIDDDGQRPLFGGDQGRLEALFAARAPVYAALPHQIETDGQTPGAVAEEVVRLWRRLTS